MQLVAYGAQDVYLTGNPQITFFKVVYRRHTNFACEAIEQTFNGTPALGGKATVPITRNGDLVTKMWLKTTAAVTGTTVAPTAAADGAGALYHLGTASKATVTGAASTNTMTVDGTADDLATLTLLGTMVLANVGQATAGTIVHIEGVDATHNGYYIVTTDAAGTGSVSLRALTTSGVVNAAATTAAVTNKYTLYQNAVKFTWNTDLGYSLISSVELQIGGTKIDKHYGRWMQIWSQLTRSTDHDNSHTQMVGPESTTTTSNSLYVPLQFFCCRNDGLALPLIALQYHDVRLEFDFATGTGVSNTGTNVSMSNTTLLTNYIYLDSEERKRFAQASHEYLIEQLQFTGVETVTAGSSNKIRLNFNHPVKELVWGVEQSWSNFTTAAVANTTNSTSDALLQLNGHDRFSKESGTFFNYVQPHTHHSRTPSAGINVYSFALNPEDHQPSGTCNFSRIDNATLSVTTASGSGTSMYVYGTNYNVLRVMSGMGGVAYSN